MKALVLTLGLLLVGISSAFGQEESVADAARRLRASKSAPIAAPTAPASTAAPDVAAAATSSDSAPTLAQGPTTWRTHRIGETFEDFAAETRFNYDTAKVSCGQASHDVTLKEGACALVRLHDKTIDTSKKYCPTCADYESFTVPMGSDNAVTITITFWKRTLAEVYVHVLRVHDMGEQLNLLIAKYGKPSNEEKLKTTNKFGASWEDMAWVWRMTDGAEIIALTSNEPSNTGLPSLSVNIKSAAMVAEKKRESEAKKVNPY